MIEALAVLWFWFSAIAVADLLTGCIHWAEDSYGSQRWGRWLYVNVVIPNRVHHHLPSVFLRSSWWGRVSTSCYASIPFFLAAAHFRSGWWCLVLLLSSQSNQIHAWAHVGRPPGLVRVLQGVRVLQSVNQHAVHHRRVTRAYCVMTPWLNPTLDVCGFWRALERGAERFFGVRVLADE